MTTASHTLKTFTYLIALLCSLLTSSLAVCIQTGASTADRSLWNTHGCWQEFFVWESKAYDLRSKDWNGRGWNDACNANLEFPKHWNAAYLVTYGLTDNLDHQFHGTTDYRQTAQAASGNFHKSIFHAPTDATDVFGSYNPSSGRVSTSCLLYNPASANANPASRAGDFMHEGWHAWLKKYKFNNGSVGGHRATQGACSAKGCDYFYFHGIGAYAFGAMYQNNGTASRFHSPNQVQVEFLCDVVDDAKDWVSKSVRDAAQADANQRSAQRFINGPGYACGSPRPW